MRGYVVSPSGQEDIRDIVDYIASTSPANAAKVVPKLYDMFERLVDFPGTGHAREELKDDRLRVVAVFKFVVIYDPKSKPLAILRVVRGTRNLWNIVPRR